MPPRNTARTLVLARNLQEFHAWCRQARTSPRDRTVLYASGPHALRGLGIVNIVRFGAWWDRPDGRAIEDAADALERRSTQIREAAHV